MADNFEQYAILIAEDDNDDFLLFKEAFEELKLSNKLYRVKNGEELLDFLRHQGAYQDADDVPRPALILLDLNMPKMDGREALQEIKRDPELLSIPVVVLTTSKAEEDIMRSYSLGVNSYIKKPVTFQELLDVLKVLKHYWFEIVELPIPQKR